MRHSFNMSKAHATLVHMLARDHIRALHNYIASAVERSEFDRAKALTADLREHQKLFAAFNIDAKEQSAQLSGREVATVHTVE